MGAASTAHQDCEPRPAPAASPRSPAHPKRRTQAPEPRRTSLQSDPGSVERLLAPSAHPGPVRDPRSRAKIATGLATARPITTTPAATPRTCAASEKASSTPQLVASEPFSASPSIRTVTWAKCARWFRRSSCPLSVDAVRRSRRNSASIAACSSVLSALASWASSPSIFASESRRRS
jgi:hypothetical protein